ncbi:hypothetical protein [Flavihumibacter sp. ZG627]|uniref:hypothetical protein n=1 Tax=Flavihumibacter sp. ZG627 TaxID=1463156 RepID=UPI00057E4A00|nr:hypothetical protein [Flavihumibacter sp. ZG627]KIC89991.1 hypothetical protein HY58_13355 [Flavihumibacter sp. ZG627]
MATDNPNLAAGMEENPPANPATNDEAGKSIQQKDNPPPKKKRNSALAAAARGESAVNHFRAHSRRDVQGSSGLSNTGPFVSYDRET